jgi:hypothetical protein
MPISKRVAILLIAKYTFLILSALLLQGKFRHKHFINFEDLLSQITESYIGINIPHLRISHYHHVGSTDRRIVTDPQQKNIYTTYNTVFTQRFINVGEFVEET